MAPFPLFGLRSDHEANGGTRLGLRNSNPYLWKNFVRSENHGLTSTESCGLMSCLFPHHSQVPQLLINSSSTNISSNPNLSLSQNTHHLFSHASSSNHLGQPLALGQKSKPKQATTSHQLHLHTVIDLDPEDPTPPAAAAASPVFIDLDPEEPAPAPAPAPAAAAWPLAIVGNNNQNRHGGVTTFMTHEVARTRLLNATSNAERFLCHQYYHNHTPIQYPPVYSRNPNKIAAHHNNNVASTSTGAPSGTVPQKFQALKYVQIFGRTFLPNRAERDKEAIWGRPKNGRNPKSQRGYKSQAYGKPNKLRYRRVYSLKHNKYGPYTCSECFGMSRTSPLFASHVSSRHPLKYRLIFSGVDEDESNVMSYLGPRPRKARAEAGPAISKNKRKKSGGVHPPKGKNMNIDPDVGPSERAAAPAPDIIVLPQFDLNYSHETIREKKRRARRIHAIATSQGACAEPAGPFGFGGPEVAGPSRSGAQEVTGRPGAGCRAEIEVPVKRVG